MFAFKKKYFLIIESIKDINLRNIKKYNKFSIIYRNQDNKENIYDLIKFRKNCRLKQIKFYVANSAPPQTADAGGVVGLTLDAFKLNSN